jgi:manganese transport protein
MQLHFAVIPLIRFVSDRRKMGTLVTPLRLPTLAWAIAAVIPVLNVNLLVDTFTGAAG